MNRKQQHQTTEVNGQRRTEQGDRSVLLSRPHKAGCDPRIFVSPLLVGNIATQQNNWQQQRRKGEGAQTWHSRRAEGSPGGQFTYACFCTQGIIHVWLAIACNGVKHSQGVWENAIDTRSVQGSWCFRRFMVLLKRLNKTGRGGWRSGRRRWPPQNGVHGPCTPWLPTQPS